jgi:hypothetical protein
VLTSLHRIEEDLMKSDGLADLLAKFMERFVEKLLLENYRALKASAYNPMRFQRSILTNTELFMNDEGLISRAAVALAHQNLAPDLAAAEAQILQDLTRIRDVFAGLGDKLDLIDRFSHKLERRIATTVRYQETARNVREERLREAIRTAFARWDSGISECVTPLVDIPVPFSTATLALPKKAREPVEPQTRRPKTIDPADVLRENLIDTYVASMDVTPFAVAERLHFLTATDTFYDLDEFQPANARRGLHRSEYGPGAAAGMSAPGRRAWQRRPWCAERRDLASCTEARAYPRSARRDRRSSPPRQGAH